MPKGATAELFGEMTNVNRLLVMQYRFEEGPSFSGFHGVRFFTRVN